MAERKKIPNLRIILLAAVAAVLLLIFLHEPKPCQKPLTYRIGQVDERFGITRSDFSAAVGKAAAIWGKPLSRELFREDPAGAIEISLVYDYRQEATDKLRQLQSRMDSAKDHHESIRTQYERLKSEYEEKRTDLENDVQTYNLRIKALNDEIESLNRRGGVSPEYRDRLMTEKNEMDAVREKLRLRQEEIKILSYEVNSMAQAMNEVAAKRNQDVDHFKNIGGQLGGEFQEGFYESKKGGQFITIYHFDNEDKLVRLLVHELGHALRLEHTKSPGSVMYRLNQSDLAELTAEDIAALAARCEGRETSR